ncbi:MAG TPA: MBL fold metallo-hydrolase [Candidatus Solibacter sp.]|nr:MBL fold metallo-hydrolase [Candidatus Solibacter sp.]
MKCTRSLVILAIFLAPAMFAQDTIPAWCKALPRPEFQALKRVTVSQDWFEVYVAAPGVFAIYEPHQSELAISYLITGERSAVLFDTGMGIGDIRKVTSELTNLPIAVLNSHTHFDHVGGNWQFSNVLAMDTEFTRRNAQGSREDAQAEIGPGQICGELPAGFDPKTYETRAWKIAGYRHDGERIEIGGRTLEIVTTPGHTPDAVCLLDRANGLLFTGDTYYRGTVWLYRPETDLAAYGASIRRLAALGPEVKTVLGAHNVAGDPGSVLAKLLSAFEAVRAGKVAGTAGTGGKVRYKVDEIGFLLRAQ